MKRVFIGKFFNIVQTHKLIFAISFTLLLIVWFVKFDLLLCPDKTTFVDGSVYCAGPGKFGYSILIIIWTAMMVVLFHKKQSNG